MKADRIPTMSDSLSALMDAGVPVRSILDIGILYGTDPLKRMFPNTRHYLFEPVDIHFDTIRQRYKRFDYELFPYAISNVDGDAWLVLRAD